MPLIQFDVVSVSSRFLECWVVLLFGAHAVVRYLQIQVIINHGIDPASILV